MVLLQRLYAQRKIYVSSLTKHDTFYVLLYTLKLFDRVCTLHVLHISYTGYICLALYH